MSINIKLEIFEGPFDLLYHLIKKNEIDIYDIPIATITDEYLQYIDKMGFLDMENASQFLVMAATLLEIKSRMLLPSRKSNELKTDDIDNNDDPRLDLVERLLEYKVFKEFSEKLKDLEIKESMFFDPLCVVEGIDKEMETIEKVDSQELIKAFHKVIISSKSIKNEEIKHRISKEEITISQKKKELLKILEDNKTLIFQKAFENKSRLEIIVSFLAMLELYRLGIINIYQNKSGDFIYISIKERWS